MKFKSKEAANEYNRQHYKVNRARSKATNHKCFFCIVDQAEAWAWIHGTDRNDIVSYVPACTPCHNKYDDAWKNPESRAKTGKAAKERWANPKYKERVGKAITEVKTGMKYNMTPEGSASIRASKIGNQYAVGKRTPEQIQRIKDGIRASQQRRKAERRRQKLEGGDAK